MNVNVFIHHRLPEIVAQPEMRARAAQNLYNMPLLHPLSLQSIQYANRIKS